MSRKRERKRKLEPRLDFDDIKVNDEMCSSSKKLAMECGVAIEVVHVDEFNRPLNSSADDDAHLGELEISKAIEEEEAEMKKVLANQNNRINHKEYNNETIEALEAKIKKYCHQVRERCERIAKIYCVICNINLTYAPETMISHMYRKHTDPKSFDVEMINNTLAIFPISGTMPPDDLKCSSCGLVFPYRFAWSKHDSSQYHDCTKCKIRFQTCTELARHMRGQCKAILGLGYTCAICSISFKNRADLQEHRSLVHFVNSNEAMNVQVKKCTRCGVKYVGLKLAHYCKGLLSKIPCLACGRRFQSHLLRQVHQKAYGKKMSSCSLCGHVMHYQCEKEVHQCMTRKKFQCTECMHFFAKRMAIIQHLTKEHKIRRRKDDHIIQYGGTTVITAGERENLEEETITTEPTKADVDSIEIIEISDNEHQEVEMNGRGLKNHEMNSDRVSGTMKPDDSGSVIAYDAQLHVIMEHDYEPDFCSQGAARMGHNDKSADVIKNIAQLVNKDLIEGDQRLEIDDCDQGTVEMDHNYQIVNEVDDDEIKNNAPLVNKNLYDDDRRLEIDDSDQGTVEMDHNYQIVNEMDDDEIKNNAQLVNKDLDDDNRRLEIDDSDRGTVEMDHNDQIVKEIENNQTVNEMDDDEIENNAQLVNEIVEDVRRSNTVYHSDLRIVKIEHVDQIVHEIENSHQLVNNEDQPSHIVYQDDQAAVKIEQDCQIGDEIENNVLVNKIVDDFSLPNIMYHNDVNVKIEQDNYIDDEIEHNAQLINKIADEGQRPDILSHRYLRPVKIEQDNELNVEDVRHSNEMYHNDESADKLVNDNKIADGIDNDHQPGNIVDDYQQPDDDDDCVIVEDEVNKIVIDEEDVRGVSTVISNSGHMSIVTVKAEPMDYAMEMEDFDDNEYQPEQSVEGEVKIEDMENDLIVLKQEDHILSILSHLPSSDSEDRNSHKNNLTCNICSKKLKSLQAMIKHNEIGLCGVVCNICSYVTNNHTEREEHFESHIRTMFKEVTGHGSNRVKRYECLHCGAKVFKRKVVDHWVSHKEIITDKVVEKPKARDTPLLPTSINLSDFIANKPDKAEGLPMEVIDVLIDTLTRKNPAQERVCTLCPTPRFMNREGDFKRHYIEHLLYDTLLKCDVDRLKCQLCEEELPNAMEYRQHMRFHAKLTLYECKLCLKYFSDSSNYSKHRKVHNFHRYMCDLCKRKFTTKRMLIKHIQSHSKPMIPCDVCYEVFPYQSLLNRHMKYRHMKSTKYSCVKCKEKFMALKEKWDHMWYVHKHRMFIGDCPYCPAAYRRYQDVKSHIVQFHKGSPVPLKRQFEIKSK